MYEYECEPLTPALLAADESFWHIYETSFPADEIEPREVIVRGVAEGVVVALRARRGHKTVGLATAHVLAGIAAGFCVYLAVDREQRGSRAGTSLMQALITAVQAAQAERGRVGLGLVLEVDDPDQAGIHAAERHTRERRIHFFARLGAVLLATPYIQPPLGPGKRPVPMRLLFIPSPGMPVPGRATIMDLIDAMLFEKYGGLNGIDRALLQDIRQQIHGRQTEPA